MERSVNVVVVSLKRVSQKGIHGFAKIVRMKNSPLAKGYYAKHLTAILHGKPVIHKEGNMDKKMIIDRLFELPGEIAAQEEAVITMQIDLNAAEAVLLQKQDELYVSGSIDGKNAEIRSAQIRQLTQVEQNQVNYCRNQLVVAKNGLSLLYNEFKALQAIAELLKGAA